MSIKNNNKKKELHLYVNRTTNLFELSCKDGLKFVHQRVEVLGEDGLRAVLAEVDESGGRVRLHTRVRVVI